MMARLSAEHQHRARLARGGDCSSSIPTWASSSRASAAAAERELRVRVTAFPVGEWDGGRLADADRRTSGC